MKRDREQMLARCPAHREISTVARVVFHDVRTLATGNEPRVSVADALDGEVDRAGQAIEIGLHAPLFACRRMCRDSAFTVTEEASSQRRIAPAVKTSTPSSLEHGSGSRPRCSLLFGSTAR